MTKGQHMAPNVLSASLLPLRLRKQSRSSAAGSCLTSRRQCKKYRSFHTPAAGGWVSGIRSVVTRKRVNALVASKASSDGGNRRLCPLASAFPVVRPCSLAGPIFNAGFGRGVRAGKGVRRYGIAPEPTANP